MTVLPPISSKKTLDLPWFPSRMHAFIFRNWDMISPERMASLLKTSKETVCNTAERMGLLPSYVDENIWLTQGYITIIRANWHILPYEQLAELLGWSIDYLAFILQEDDFLSTKLGKEKPNIPTLKAVIPDENMLLQEKKICDSVTKALLLIGKRTASPFDFSLTYPHEKSSTPIKSIFDTSFCYSYCALYGDTFSDDALIEKSFPDELLASYAALGVGGIWTQAVLYTLTPCEVNPKLSAGYEKRIQGLNKVISKLKKYGLKLYLYINEPREMSLDFFESHPDWKGDIYDKVSAGYASLCLSNPEVQDFLRDSIYFLTKKAPGLGGYITITASENHTNCYSHKNSGETNCPRCKRLRRSDLYALTNRLIYEGASKADPNISVMAYCWEWDRENGCFEETLDKLPREIAILGVSERAKPKTTAGITVPVIDYSISVPGPSDYMTDLFSKVKARNMKIVSKIQMNVSWELCPLPYIPVFGHFYQAIKGVTERVMPDILMLTWTHGGHPSPPMKMMSLMTEKGKTIPTLNTLLKELFPHCEHKNLIKAIECFDKAFDEYPFSLNTMYKGPQHMGASAPLFAAPTGWNAAMIGPVYDDIDTWASDEFNRYILSDQLFKMTELWRSGIPYLIKAVENDPTYDAKLLKEVAYVALYHLEAAYLHTRFVISRENGDKEEMKSIAKKHADIAISEAMIINENPCIGYEASNHYLFTRQDMIEKIVNCNHLLSTL